MLGNLLMTLRHRLPDFPGRQGIFSGLDRAFGPFVATTADGIRLRVLASSYMDGLYFDPHPDQASDTEILRAEIGKLREGDVMIDIGANIGCHAIRASRRVKAAGLVLACEPSPRELARLLANIELNACENIVPLSLALSDEPGLLDLNLAATHTGMNTLRVADSAAHAFKNSGSRRVAVLRFDDAIAPLLGDRTVRLLKIDVEGAEFAVLSGTEESLRRGLFATIVTEITPEFLERFGHSKEQLYALLGDCGYRPRLQSSAWQYDEVFERA